MGIDMHYLCGGVILHTKRGSEYNVTLLKHIIA